MRQVWTQTQTESVVVYFVHCTNSPLWRQVKDNFVDKQNFQELLNLSKQLILIL